MPENTPPLRFRTPPGWPTPSPEWVALYQGAEPAAGWSPAPDLPAAPRHWVFWIPTRALRRRVPRSLTVSMVVGAALTLVSFAAVLVLAMLVGASAPAALALAPMTIGTALWVVGGVRYGDHLAAAVRAGREEAAARRDRELPTLAREQHPDGDTAQARAAWDAHAWSSPSARPFHQGAPSATLARFQRVLSVATAGLAGLLLVVGASVTAVPTAESVGSDLAWALGSDSGDDAPSLEWSSDDDAITAYWLGSDDTWEETCDVTQGTTPCDAYEIDSDESCAAVVTMGFFAHEDDDQPSRTQERTVRLTAGVPLVLVENHDEEASSIGDVSCVTDDQLSGDRIAATQATDEHVDAASLPDGCDVGGCVAVTVTPEADCDAAAVQFRVADSVGAVDGRHDVVVVTALRAGTAANVFAGGTEDASDVLPGMVTCHAGADDGRSEDS